MIRRALASSSLLLLILSSGQAVEVPKVRVEVPRVRVEVPRVRVQVPRVNVQAQTPRARVRPQISHTPPLNVKQNIPLHADSHHHGSESPPSTHNLASRTNTKHAPTNTATELKTQDMQPTNAKNVATTHTQKQAAVQQQGQGGDDGQTSYNPPANICPVKQCSSTVNNNDGLPGDNFYTVSFQWSGSTPPQPPPGMHYLNSNQAGCGGGTCTLFVQFNSPNSPTVSNPSSGQGGSISSGMSSIANVLLPQAGAETLNAPPPGSRFIYSGVDNNLRNFREYADQNNQWYRVYDGPAPTDAGNDSAGPPNGDGGNQAGPVSPGSGGGNAGNGSPPQPATISIPLPNGSTLTATQTPDGNWDVPGHGTMTQNQLNTLALSGGGTPPSPTSPPPVPPSPAPSPAQPSQAPSAQAGNGNGSSGNTPPIPTAAACPQDGCQGVGGFTYSEPPGGFKTSFSSLSDYISYLNSLPTPNMQQSFKNNTTNILQQLLNQSQAGMANGSGAGGANIPAKP